MLFILFLSTVTCISTGVPFRDIEAVYTPGVYIFSLYVPVLLSEITFEELVVLAGFPSLSEEFAADTIKENKGNDTGEDGNSADYQCFHMDNYDFCF